MLCIFLAYCEYSNVDMQDEQILRMFVPLLVFTQFILQAGQVDIELFVQYGKTWTLELGQFGFQVQTNTKKTKKISSSINTYIFNTSLTILKGG